MGFGKPLLATSLGVIPVANIIDQPLDVLKWHDSTTLKTVPCVRTLKSLDSKGDVTDEESMQSLSSDVVVPFAESVIWYGIICGSRAD